MHAVSNFSIRGMSASIAMRAAFLVPCTVFAVYVDRLCAEISILQRTVRS